MRASCEVLFANITEMSDKALHYLQYDTAQIVAAVETHWCPSKDNRGAQKVRKWSAQDRHLIVSLPRASLSSSTGTYGGVVASIGRSLHFQTLPEAQRIQGIRASAWQGHSPFLTGFQLGFREGLQILFFFGYHRHSLQRDLLHQVSKYTR